jgi:hypothetical protein
MMSAMGVTLMSAIAPPFLSPTAIDMARLLGFLESGAPSHVGRAHAAAD